MSDPTSQVRPKPSLLTDMDVRNLIAPALVRICAEHGNDRAALEIGVDEFDREVIDLLIGEPVA